MGSEGQKMTLCCVWEEGEDRLCGGDGEDR